MSHHLRSDLQKVGEIIQRHIDEHQALIATFKADLDRETENPEHVHHEEETITRNEAIISTLYGILKEIESI